ncbi:dCTP deaminase [Halobaculum sp. EA56]|uniref:dCTP deaminase n=1 Tax=Halobaculum sp. EA56 TaxID=3421648 RepID=UPI003EBD0DDF
MTLADRLDGIVHGETQVRGDGDRVDLTLAGVHAVDDPGAVDFGGGELADGSLAPIDPERRDPDDEYGWWDLAAGTYVITLNESLAGDDPVTLRPRTELVARGAGHPTLRTASLPALPLTVSRTVDGDGVGIRLKENARVSTVRTE